MLVHRTDISADERLDFEQAIRACGQDPGAFSAEIFETTLAETGTTLRRVHVSRVGTCTAAQYEATNDARWTNRFAHHLASGVFG